MNINYQSICGRLGRYMQLLRDARLALQEAYNAHMVRIAQYDRCLKYANERAEIYRGWAKAAQSEKEHWRKRALAAEKENFELKINK